MKATQKAREKEVARENTNKFYCKNCKPLLLCAHVLGLKGITHKHITCISNTYNVNSK